MDKSIILILLIFLLVIPVYAQNDSFEQSSQELKLQIDSCNIYKLKLTTDRKKQMMALAKKSGSNQILFEFFEKYKQYGSASCSRMQHVMLKNNLDSVYYYYKETVINFEKYEKVDSYILLPFIQDELVRWGIYNGYYELAIRTVKEMEQFNIDNRLVDNLLWTYQLLSTVYMMIDKPTESIKVAKKGLELDINQPKTRTLWYVRSQIYQQLIQCYSIGDDNDNSLYYCDKMLEWIDEMADYGFEGQNLVDYADRQRFIVYLWKMENYSILGNADKAKTMQKEAEVLFELVRNGKFYNENILLTQKTSYAIYYYHILKNYGKAMEHTQETLDFLKQSQRYPEYLNGIRFMADMHTETGNYEKSNELRSMALELSDSLKQVDMSKEINELWTLFEVDKAHMEKEQSELKAQKLQITAGSTSFVMLLFAAFAIFLTVNNKKLKAKNRKLFKQQKEQNDTENDFVDLTHYDVQLDIKDELPLYDRIVEYILSSRRYTNPHVTRESMAAELGTNRHYVTEAIQKNANMNFSEFINNFRLKYAHKLLLGENDIQIKRVYLESGFANRTTFSRLFREKYGMTPTEFRACANEELEKGRGVYQYE